MPSKTSQNNKVVSSSVRLKPVYFLVIGLLSTFICLFSLRGDNEHMLMLRDAVYSADKQDTNVAKALQDLQAYVTTHMNTNLSTGNGSVYPPIQLKYTYDRLVQSKITAAEASNSLYTDAQSFCQDQIPTGFSGRTRVPCIEQYVLSHNSTLPTVPDSLYKFDFMSPAWSPDLAGWSMVIAIVSITLFIATLLRSLIKRRS